METKQDYIERIYEEAKKKGLCHNKGQFASLLGISAGTFSKLLAGEERYLTDNIVKRIKAWEEQMLEPSSNDIVIPAATARFYETLSESIRNMSETILHQQELISRLAK